MAREVVTGSFPVSQFGGSTLPICYDTIPPTGYSTGAYLIHPNPFIVPPQPNRIWHIYSVNVSAHIYLVSNSNFDTYTIPPNVQLGVIKAGLEIHPPTYPVGIQTGIPNTILNPPLDETLLGILYNPYSDADPFIYNTTPSLTPEPTLPPQAKITVAPPYPARIIAGQNPIMGIWITPSVSNPTQSSNASYQYIASYIKYSIAYDNGL